MHKSHKWQKKILFPAEHSWSTTSTVNAQLYIEILHTFLNPMIENSFDDDEVSGWTCIWQMNINAFFSLKAYQLYNISQQPGSQFVWKFVVEIKKTGPWQGAALHEYWTQLDV